MADADKVAVTGRWGLTVPTPFYMSEVKNMTHEDLAKKLKAILVQAEKNNKDVEGHYPNYYEDGEEAEESSPYNSKAHTPTFKKATDPKLTESIELGGVRFTWNRSQELIIVHSGTQGQIGKDKAVQLSQWIMKQADMSHVARDDGDLLRRNFQEMTQMKRAAEAETDRLEGKVQKLNASLKSYVQQHVEINDKLAKAEAEIKRLTKTDEELDAELAELSRDTSKSSW